MLRFSKESVNEKGYLSKQNRYDSVYITDTEFPTRNHGFILSWPYVI